MASDIIAVLLVEDNPADAILINEFLENNTCSLTAKIYQWEITHVSRLNLALAHLEQKQFDVALLDLSLPDSTGLNVVVQIHARSPGLPLLVLTGLDDEAIGLEAVRRGAQDYLVKGQFDRNLLLKAVRYAIERAESQRTMRQQTAAMAASSDGMAILNQDYHYLYANQSYANLYGYSEVSQLLGQPWTLLQLEPNGQLLTQKIQADLQAMSTWMGEVNGIRSDGTVLDLELSITRFDHGSFVCLVRDIHDRKRIQAELQSALEKERELSQLKSSFMAMVSHEFRTPLTGIRIAADLLEQCNDQLSDDQKTDYFNRIQTCITEMVQLLDEVLLLHRSQEGGLRYEPTPFDLENFCRELAEAIQFNSANSHRINFDCQGGCTEAEMDTVLLRHMLTNLLSNAVKYSPKGEAISFLLQCHDGKAVIQIRDQGIGMAKKDLDHLFEPFYRCSNVGQIPGTGLGLAIVQQCVELHQGTIDVTSSLGAGTTFIIKLPLHPDREN